MNIHEYQAKELFNNYSIPVPKGFIVKSQEDLIKHIERLEENKVYVVKAQIHAYVIDKIIAGFNKKMNVMIISSKTEEINDFILNKLERGTTLYNASGGFSKENKTVISTVVNKKQYIKIKNYISNIDSKAFVTIGFVHNVHGEGF